MSTGYPNSETGHPTNFYTFVHQNPQVLVGNLAYDFANPKYFLEAHNFITKELAEALRRTGDQSAGILHFALLTWFRNVYDANKIEMYPNYYGMKNALSPVLVSAELWGRHFYAGSDLSTRICIVNDLEDGSDLSPSDLRWELQVDDKTIASGNERIPTTRHYCRQWINPRISIPAHLPDKRVNARLVLKLQNEGHLIAGNEYPLVLAEKAWIQPKPTQEKKISLVDFSGIRQSFDYLEIKHMLLSSVTKALKNPSDLLVLSGLNKENTSEFELKQLREQANKGGSILLLNSEEAVLSMYPEYITGKIIPSEGDIVNMEIPESCLFDGLERMDLRYFNNNKREIPTVCYSVLKVNRHPTLEELTSQTKIHGYINGEMQERSDYVKSIRGTTLVKIKGQGYVTISTMALDKASTDPVAGKLLINMINDLLNVQTNQ
jgi:hypothetical protein